MSSRIIWNRNIRDRGSQFIEISEKQNQTEKEHFVYEITNYTDNNEPNHNLVATPFLEERDFHTMNGKRYAEINCNDDGSAADLCKLIRSGKHLKDIKMAVSAYRDYYGDGERCCYETSYYECKKKLQGAPTEQLECLTKIRNTATAIKYTIHISQPADKIMYEIETENPVTGNKRRRRLLQSGNGGGC